MALNIVIDSMFGTVPIVGDIFDAVFKANLKNLNILKSELARGDLKPRDKKDVANGVIFLSIILLLSLAAIVFALIVSLVRLF